MFCEVLKKGMGDDMNELDMMEFMDMIEPKYIQESYETHLKGGSKQIVRWWYYAGLAACLAISILSGTLLAVGGLSGGSDMIDDSNLATVAGTNGSLIVVIMLLALVAAGAFLYLIIRKKRGNG